jgi:hypothetical protein
MFRESVGQRRQSQRGRDLKPPGLVDPYASVITFLAQLVVAIAYALIIAPLARSGR